MKRGGNFFSDGRVRRRMGRRATHLWNCLRAMRRLTARRDIRRFRSCRLAREQDRSLRFVESRLAAAY